MKYDCQLIKCVRVYCFVSILMVSRVLLAGESAAQIDAVDNNSTSLPVVTIDAVVSTGLFNHQLFDQVLADVVVETPFTTMIDYTGLKNNPSSLVQYLDRLAAVKRSEFDGWPKSEQLAFLINAYNAWTLKLIIDGYPGIDSIRDLGNFFSSPWQKDFIPLFKQMVSLDHIEHTLIRDADRYQDARIHFAVNCASIGCPALRSEAYTAQNLEQQLDQQTRQFLADRSRNYVNGDQIFLSKIFDWYGDDFARGWNGSQSLSQFLLNYSASLNLDDEQKLLLQKEEMEIEFLPYDWQLNDIQMDAAK